MASEQMNQIINENDIDFDDIYGFSAPYLHAKTITMLQNTYMSIIYLYAPSIALPILTFFSIPSKESELTTLDEFYPRINIVNALILLSLIAFACICFRMLYNYVAYLIFRRQEKKKIEIDSEYTKSVFPAQFVLSIFAVIDICLVSLSLCNSCRLFFYVKLCFIGFLLLHILVFSIHYFIDVNNVKKANL